MEWQIIVFALVILFLLAMLVWMVWGFVSDLLLLRRKKKEMNIHQWKARRADPKGVLEAGKPKIGQHATTMEIPGSPWKTVPIIFGEQRLPRGSFVGVWFNKKHSGKSEKELWDLVQEHRTLMIDDERTPYDIEGYRDQDAIVLTVDCARGRGFHAFIGQPKGLLLDHFLKGVDTISDYLDWFEKNAKIDPDDFWWNCHSADHEWAMKDYRRVGEFVDKLEKELSAKTTTG